MSLRALRTLRFPSRSPLHARACSSSAAPATPAYGAWAIGGWVFFIAENALLSENRSAIITALGDDAKESRYHALYGTMSTLAVGSIIYGYVRKVRNAPPFLWSPLASPPLWRLSAGGLCMALGGAALSQAVPRLQAPAVQRGGEWSPRCPFDFVDEASQTSAPPAAGAEPEPRGLKRVSRHSGFWSLGLCCLGGALCVPSAPQAAWLCGPALVALVGGAHQDMRHRRGMGGTLTPKYEAATSNVPFVALLSGAQGAGAWTSLADEIKMSNAIAAAAAAAWWALRHVR